jgi:Na+-transporting NADH:ubiquinone oxidoreductase subunit C
MGKLNTNSNAYIIIYSAILVVIVAFLLAFIFKALKPMQDANVALDKKKQILASLNIRNLNDSEAEAQYKNVVRADYIIQKDECDNGPENFDEYDGESAGFKLGKADYKAGKLVVYFCEVAEGQKLVIPVYGRGLWGGIWGYVALNQDGTVFGAYFDHESETAGLGAEIKDSRAWQEKFIGKKYIDEPEGQPISIVLGVKKASEIKNPEAEVDAITGATLTSNGVDEMLKECLGKYKNFFLHNGWGGE